MRADLRSWDGVVAVNQRALQTTVRHRRSGLVGFGLGLLLWGCLPGLAIAAEGSMVAEIDASLATTWFTLHRTLVQQTPGFSPPVAGRAFGYLGLTLYESVVAGMPGHRSLVGHLSELRALPRPAEGATYVWPEVANAAIAHMTRALFSNTSATNASAIDDLEEQWTARHAEGTDAGVIERARAHGLALAPALHAWSQQDGGDHGQLTNYQEEYVPPSGPGLWVPTPRTAGQPFPALQPRWGDNRSFVAAVVSACSPPPPVYSEDPTSSFYAEALEVYEVVRAVTPDQREKAQFWSDEGGATATPAGHWMAILTTVLVQQERSLAFAAEAYAKLGMTLSDAFVACWDTKFRDNLLRPITYIRAFIDPTWNAPTITDPLLTPPFPEYTSGHSVVSAAAAHVLTDLFGDDVGFVDDFHVGRGFAPREYANFWEAALEAAASRLYGGVHFRTAIEVGLSQGQCVGERITALPFGSR